MIINKNIQILRCFSIVIIILFHLNHLKSGYLGVDTFLIISSFLNINKQKHMNIKDRLITFSSRINRILPSSLLISTLFIIYADNNGCCTYQWIEEYKNTLFFSSNTYYYNKSDDYFNVNNTSYFLHYWYLSIQLYLYILLLIPYLLYISETTLVIFAISSALYYFTFFSYKNANYYFLSPRLWEVIMGGLNISHKHFIISSIVIMFMMFYCIIKETRDVYDQFVFVVSTTIFLNTNTYNTYLSYGGIIISHISNLSYILYLIHYPLTKLNISKYYIFILILLSEILFYIYEKPILFCAKEKKNNNFIYYYFIIYFFILFI